MAWTASASFTPGEVLTATKLNEQVVGNLQAVRDLVIVTKSGASSGLITFDTEVVDDFDITLPSSYVEVPWAGRFSVTFYTAWTGATGTGSATITLQRFNSSDVLQENFATDSDSVSAWPFYRTVSGICVCDAADRIKATVTTSASGSAGSTANRLAVQACG